MSRRLRYQVAMSLDGFIAGPNGEYDWILMDPSIDFAGLFEEFDTAADNRDSAMRLVRIPMMAKGVDHQLLPKHLARFSREKRVAHVVTYPGKSR